MDKMINFFRKKIKNIDQKFIYMSLLIFFLVFVRNILRNLKDSMIANQIGSESISFIAIFLHIPISFLFLKFYYRISKTNDLSKIFSKVLSIFLLIFIFFSFIFIPNKNFFLPSDIFIKKLIISFPKFTWIIKIWSKWPFAIFAVFAELWSVVICSTCYWQLANKIMNKKESSKYYIYLSTFGQMSLIFSPIVSFFFEKICFNSILQENLFIYYISFICTFLSITAFFLYKKTEKKFSICEEKKFRSNNNENYNFIKSIKYLISSKILTKLCIITFSYSAIMSWSDGIITCMTKKMYQNIYTLYNYKSKLLFCIGFFTLIFSFFGNFLIKKKGWKFITLSIPIVILFTGTLFFIFSFLFEKNIISNIFIVIFFASIYTIFSKSIKYSLFDGTKEMVYLNLDFQTKKNGQVVVDIIGDGIGKILGSGLQIFIFSFFPKKKHENLIEPIFILFFVVSIIWIYAILFLEKNIKSLKKN